MLYINNERESKIFLVVPLVGQLSIYKLYLKKASHIKCLKTRNLDHYVSSSYILRMTLIIFTKTKSRYTLLYAELYFWQVIYESYPIFH